jgi:hypothetical protein
MILSPQAEEDLADSFLVPALQRGNAARTL